MRRTSSQTSKSYLLSLKVTHFIILGQQIIFLGVILFLRQSLDVQKINELASLLNIIVPIFALVIFFISRFFFQLKVKHAIREKNLSAKLSEYRIASLMQWGLVGGAASFSIVAYFLTANLSFLAITAVMLGLLILQRPILPKIIETLQLSLQEKQILENPDSVVIE